MTTGLGLSRSRPSFGLGQPFEKMLGIPEWAGDAIRIVVHGSATWLGLHVGLKEEGALSVIGYVFGIVNGIGTFLDLISILEQAAGGEVRQGDRM